MDTTDMSIFDKIGYVFSGGQDSAVLPSLLWDMLAVVLAIIGTIIISAIVTRLIRKFVNTKLANTAAGGTSFFVNIGRAVVWVVFASFLCEPMFGVQPHTIITALGVTSLVVSLGLQSTVANVFAGFQIMSHHLFTAGDHIQVGEFRGEVVDVTWRETTIRDLNGDVEVIPNALLNTTTLVKYTVDNGYRHLFDLEIRPDADLDATAADICTRADAALDALGIRQEGYGTKVFYLDATAYGVRASVRIYVKREEDTSPGRDAVLRAIQRQPYLSDCTNARPLDALADGDMVVS